MHRKSKGPLYLPLLLSLDSEFKECNQEQGSVTSRPFMYGILNDGATNEPTNRGNKLVICLFKWLRLCFMRLFEYHNNYSKFNAKHLYTNYHFSLLPFHLSILSIYNQRPLPSLPQTSHIQTGPINSHFLPFFQKKKKKLDKFPFQVRVEYRRDRPDKLVSEVRSQGKGANYNY